MSQNTTIAPLSAVIPTGSPVSAKAGKTPKAPRTRKPRSESAKPAAPVAVPASACRTPAAIRGAMLAAATDARYLLPTPGQIKQATDAGFPIVAKPDGTYRIGGSGAAAARFVVALYADTPGSDARTLQIHYADGSTDSIRTLANMIVGKRARTPRVGK